MTHLGPQLSALIDGELEASERERVIWHMHGCGSCREEAAALHALKRRMNGLGEAAAGAALTTRLMSQLLGLEGAGLQPGEAVCPPPPPGPWPTYGPTSQDVRSAGRNGRQDQRAGRLFLAGSVAIFLAGLGTAAVIAGGEPQAQAPAPPVAPSVDVLVAPHSFVNPGPVTGPGSGVLRRGSRVHGSNPDVDSTYMPGQP